MARSVSNASVSVCRVNSALHSETAVVKMPTVLCRADFMFFICPAQRHNIFAGILTLSDVHPGNNEKINSETNYQLNDHRQSISINSIFVSTY